ncbi:hypothetical protein MKX01_028964 [Papaver californicum]|nr:hypothetical protein MKX01_028964 [Papaver californicum]
MARGSRLAVFGLRSLFFVEWSAEEKICPLSILDIFSKIIKVMFKKKKLLEGTDALIGGEMEDRINKLSDPLLCHIMYFLPFERIVATSALAKRWRSYSENYTSVIFRSSQRQQFTDQDFR